MTEYAWPFRYPGDIFEPAQDEVEAALAFAMEVVEAIAKAVPA
jgi:hypothetical protein